MNNILIVSFLFLFTFPTNAQVKNYLIEGSVKNIAQRKIFLAANSLDTAYYLGSNTLDSSNINTEFPKLKLKTLSGKEVYFETKELNAKYTLVDFWFLRCAPCREQFPFYKKTFDMYSKKDFNIIGISIDNEVDSDKINALFHEKKLKWTNLLDEKGANATRLGIHSYPTNFLLDQNGIIIRKNISLTELDLFLQDTINSQNIYDIIEPEMP